MYILYTLYIYNMMYIIYTLHNNKYTLVNKDKVKIKRKNIKKKQNKER